MKQLVLLLFLLASLTAEAQKMRKNDLESGMLEKGEKVGVWEYYAYTRDGSQVVTQKYDHTTKKLLFYRPFDDVPYAVQNAAGDWTRQRVKHPVFFIGGDAALAQYISKLNYPAAAQNKNVQGRVLVSFVVDTLGQASNHQVVLGIGSGCDEEALRVARSIPAQWIPARIGSRAVVSKYELPFTFRMRP
ncbi:protein TonB [Hymenobacter luteus]|uniref:Protein TonB n=2 Tax=Hymenobacter TaxID=89966 RepID=A0A7W9SZL9_9BACT|nr:MULTISPECIES: energy transducer TonB [Hymenobacter]MBB4599566.1 protein TonB [Hymenobacter latericoloratus]MBB6058124.1 protein TonB [Hymenobacter luteus]